MNYPFLQVGVITLGRSIDHHLRLLVYEVLLVPLHGVVDQELEHAVPFQLRYIPENYIPVFEEK